MQKIVIHGTPITPKALIEELAGSSFCVSYFDKRQADDAVRLVGDDQILLLDNGAFSAWTQGIDLDDEYWEGYYTWAEEILARCPQAIAIIPDTITGTTEENDRLVAESPFDTGNSMPVWHMHEPIERLIHYAHDYNWIGIGSSAEYAEMSTPAWTVRIEELFAELERWYAEEGREGGYVMPRLHMLRGNGKLKDFPFDSADSTNVARNHCRYKKEGSGHVARFAKRVDDKVQASCTGVDTWFDAHTPVGDVAAWDTVDLSGVHPLLLPPELRRDDMTKIETTPERVIVKIDGTPIGAIRHVERLGGWLFNSLLPGSPAQSRKARPLAQVQRYIARKWPAATFETESPADRWAHLVERCYMTRRVEVGTGGELLEIHDRNYRLIGTLGMDMADAFTKSLAAAKNVEQTWDDYSGGGSDRTGFAQWWLTEGEL